MSVSLLLPRLSDTMQDGTVLRWLRGNGEHVQAGEAVVEVETDKATVEIEAPSDGALHIIVGEGQTASVGEVLAKVAARVPEATAAHVRATPVARRMAATAGVELAEIAPGSGPHGRIHKVDVERFVGAFAPDPPLEYVSESPQLTQTGDQLIEPSRMHATIARRMTQAKREIPHYYLSVTVEMARALELRDELAGDSDPIRASVTDFVLLACARALRTVPQVNASWSEAGIVSHGAVAVGFAVALADDGLVVPVLRDVDRLSLAELVEARVAAVSRARAGSLGPDELEGATFTVSNLGMLGVTEFHAIVNPPESGILAIGAIEDRVIPVDGSPAIRPMTTISLSADHRVYSGATAAKFISAVKRGIESPVRILAASCSRKHGRG